MGTKASYALAAALLLLGGCAKEQEKETEPVLPVRLGSVQQGSLRRIIRATGVLRAIDQSAVMPKISAPVKKFYINRGDHVRVGQLLATLENTDLAANVTDSKGAYQQAAANYRVVSAATVPDEVVKAEADVHAARQQLDVARKLLDSREQLHKEGALARRLVDEAAVAHAQAKSQLDTAQRHLQSVQSVARLEEVKAAEGQMLSAKGRYEAAQAQFQYSEVRSPIAGVVADRPTFAGEMASPGTPLLTVVDVSSVIARVNVPQADAAHVRVGQPARIASSDGASAAGKVTVVSPAMDPQSTTVEIWVQAPNPGERLRPGGAVQVEIVAETLANTLIVPVEALLPADEGGSALYVVGKDLVAHQRKVRTGVTDGGQVQILGGVDAGDRVVIAGGVGLADGGKVKIVEAGAKE